jgi:addiction module HigA family antidote
MFPGHLNDLINAKRAMSIPIALRLEKVLGTDAAFWMKLQIDYDIELARDDEYIKKILSKANPVK